MIKLNCKTCGKFFNVYPCKKDKPFCSRKCFAQGMRGRIPWNKGKTPIKECPKCHKLFSFSKRPHQTYCSWVCRPNGECLRGKKMSDENKEKLRIAHPHLTGEKSPHWKGGIPARYKEEYKEKYRFIAREYGKRRRKAEGHHSFYEWSCLLKKYNYSCAFCKTHMSETKITEDHIIPLSKGGNNYIENIQPLCGICNSRKGVKFISLVF